MDNNAVLVTAAIRRVAYNRRARGASNMSIIGWLAHMRFSVWRNSPYIAQFCKTLSEEI